MKLIADQFLRSWIYEETGEDRAACVSKDAAASRDTPHNCAVTEPIKNVSTASQAINIIVEQGEGTTTTPSDLEGQFAHYRFAEIFNGRALIKNPKAGPITPPDQRYI